MRLLSVTFSLPFRLYVEGVGTEDIFAMNPKKCSSSQCPPIVMAWECHFASDPKCSDLNRTPPKDLCGETAANAIAHSLELRETRWVCPVAEASDGSLQVGFSVFDLEHGQLVVSYLGSVSGMPPSEFLDYVATTIRAK
jgi:hypothetical protein